MNLLEFIELSMKAESDQDVFDGLTKLSQSFDLPMILHSDIIDADTSVVSNGMDNWLNSYIEQDFFSIDPVFQNVMQMGRPFSWADNDLIKLMRPAQKRFMSEAATNGLINGFTVPLASIPGRPGIATFCSPDPGAVHAKAMPHLTAASIHFHMRTSKNGKGGVITLSPREKDCLAWASMGKTYGETADILGLSDSTIKEYFSSAIRKLDVTNTTAAVAKAIRLGVIVP